VQVEKFGGSRAPHVLHEADGSRLALEAAAWWVERFELGSGSLLESL